MDLKSIYQTLKHQDDEYESIWQYAGNQLADFCPKLNFSFLSMILIFVISFLFIQKKVLTYKVVFDEWQTNSVP